MPNEESKCCQRCSDSNAVAGHLEDLAYTRITVVNSKDFNHSSDLGLMIRRHLAPDYRAFLDNIDGGMSFDEECRMLAAQEPHIKCYPTAVRAEVDMELRQATVFTQMKIKNYGVSTGRGLSLFTEENYRLEQDGTWKLYQHEKIRSGDLGIGL